MTDKEAANDKFERLSERIDNLPAEAPTITTHAPNRAILVTSIIQLVFVVIALIGVVGLVLRVEDNRVVQCGYANQTRAAIVSVFQDIQADGKDREPESAAYIQEQIDKFRPINCKNPSNPPTTSTSSP